jgi:hypothetical protein
MRDHRSRKANLRLDVRQGIVEAKRLKARAVAAMLTAWGILAELDIKKRIKEVCYIVPKDGIEAVPFDDWWPAQEETIDWCIECFKDGTPIKVLLHKSRQEGLSTIIAALFFVILIHVPNFGAYLVAHLRDDALGIFERVKAFYDNMPTEERDKLPATVGKAFIKCDAPSNSSIRVRTAKTFEIGRGARLRGAHLSEFAFYPYPEKLLQAVLQAAHGEAIVVIESTACGKNYFWVLCDQAQKGENDWKFFFFSWTKNRRNSIPLEPGEVLELDDETRRRQKLYNLTDEQVKWMVDKWRNVCGRTWEVFDQEYPIESELAFLYTGNPLFNRKKIANDLTNIAKDPIWRGDIEFTGPSSIHPKLNENPDGSLCIWAHPVPGHRYVSGWDYSEGVGADFHAGWVADLDTHELVALYENNVALAYEVAKVGFLMVVYYYHALYGGERNSCGQAVLGDMQHGSAVYKQMTGYTNLYYDEREDIRTKEVSRKIGFTTSKSTKKPGLIRLRDDYNDGRWIVYDRRTLLQMDGFALNLRTGSFEQNMRDSRTNLCHDDLIMSQMITHEMARYNANKKAFVKNMKVDAA